MLERQLPGSDSHLVVYQLVVPQLAVRRLFNNSVARVLLNSAPSHSASVALRTCSLEHFRRHPRMEIQKDVRVGDTATTTPGPVHPSFPSQIVVAPHHGSISCIDVFSRLRSVTCQSCGLYRTCRILFEQRSLSCCSHFICSMKICVRICGQQLTINGIITQQASRQTQTGTKHALMRRKT